MVVKVGKRYYNKKKMNVDAHTEATFHANADMIFVKNFTRPAFLGPKFYTKKCVNRDNAKFTTNQRKCFKMPLLLALVTKFHQ